MLDRLTAAQALHDVVAALRAGVALPAVLRTLLAEVRGMLEASEAYILWREGTRLRLRAAAGLPEGSAGRELGWGEGLEGWAAANAEPVVLPNAGADPRFRDPFGRGQPVGAFAAYPMVLRGEVVGIIAAARAAPGRFGGPDLWWLDLLGGLAAAVVENERARQTEERRARQAEILLDITRQSAGEGDSLLPRLAAALTRSLEVDRVSVLLLDESGRSLLGQGAGAALPPAGPPIPERFPLAAGGPLVEVYRSGQPYLCADARADPAARPLLESLGAGSALAVPIAVADQRRGVLLLTTREPAGLGAEDQAFLQMVAARVGMLLAERELRQHRAEVERERAEAAARQDFVGIVSHELKTPVAVIQAYTDLLLRRAERAGDAANADVLRRVGDQAARMLQMIEQLLDLQRLEAGLFHLETSRFELLALVRRVAEEVGATASRGQKVVVAAEPAAGPLSVVADRRRVEEVLQNLLQNALKFSPEGGRVTVSVGREPGAPSAAGEGAPAAAPGEGLVVMVRDEGIGIPPEEQARVFERFYQGRHRLREGRVGLGLGLYISREIARRHGGDLRLASQPGAGSAFSLVLPAPGPDEPDPPESPEA